MFEIRSVSKQFHGEYALQDVSLTIGKGLNFLIGASGSGKTTLLKILTAMEQEFEGQAFYDRQDLKNLSARQKSGYYNDVFGFIWQDFNLLEERTVLENVMLPQYLKETPGEQVAMRMLRELHIAELAHKKVETLSGGQKQRVSIVRELLKDPQVILADEPTGALDRATSTEIMELLRELSAERLVVVITHDAKICAFADEVIHIQNYKIVSEHPTARPTAKRCLHFSATNNPSLRNQAIKISWSTWAVILLWPWRFPSA